MRPDGEGYIGSYVKAIHDFHTDLAGEVNLVKGDIFKVTKVIDKNWLQGSNKDKEGNFPTDFVEKLNIPLTEEGQKVFAALENFPAQQDGDLEFRKGDVIVGLSAIDDFWWQGQKGHVTGIFPITHVMELEISRLLKQRSKSVHAAETLFAQALVDAVAQLDEELSFQAGDIITVTEVMDEDWYVGECRGKSGMFLAACVQLLNEDECNQSGVRVNDSNDKKPGFEKESKSSMKSQSDHQSTYSVQPEFIRQNHVNGEDISHSVQTNNRHSSSDSNTYTSENTKAHHTDTDAGVTPYARTLYAFTGELVDELSFAANDIVTLIQHVDEQWIEGEIDGKIGVFPVNYVDIVVDCPYAFDIDNRIEEVSETQEPFVDNGSINGPSNRLSNDFKLESVSQIDQNAQNGQDNQLPSTSKLEVVEPADDHGEEQYALVLYSFTAERDNDLSVTEGDTVTFVKQVDENWIMVKNDHGQTGMCPSTFVDVIGAPPTTPSKTHDSNDNEIKKQVIDNSIQDKTISDVSKHKTHATSSPTSKVCIHKPALSGRSTERDDVTLPGNSCTSITRTDKPSSAIVKSSHDSEHQTSPNPVRDSNKPQLRPKPVLAPKPALKPKPALMAKPFMKPEISVHKPVSFQPSAGIPKSSSSRTLSQYASDLDTDQTGSMTKAQSMFEINKNDLPNSETNLETSSNPGSTSSLNLSNHSNERRKSTDSDSKKMFENWDLSKPLDSLLNEEFSKAAQDAEIRSRSSTNRSSGSSSSSRNSENLTNTNHPTSVNKTSQLYTGNYSRDNFESGLMGGVAVGNSTFFTNDAALSNQQKRGHVRKPPPPPLSRTSNITEEFTRKPSLKKPAPPRPVGPRMAPAPSKTPMVPTRTVPAKTVAAPSPPPSQTGRIPARPPGGGRRPAPPRPQATPTTKSAADDLMSFSPTNSSIYLPDDESNEEILELKAQITHLENDIQGFEKSKCELVRMQQNVGEDGEIHDNIQFYTDNIQGLTTELTTLREQLAQLCPTERSKIDQEKLAAQRKIAEEKLREEQKRKREEEIQERMEKRERVIDELIQTEKDFLTSLSMIMETFLSPNAEKHKDVDVEQLFGNIEEVAEVSQKLLTKLEEATCGKDFTQQVIGTCFVCLAEDMKNVYAPYCRNHDNVITLMEKYNQNPEIKAHFERLLDKLREQHVVFDLEALLIKPVQRILKYPLLLNELFKSTEDEHVDKQESLKAINVMTDVAQAINEYKRRKDLVYKYKKDSDVSLGDKLSKLSLHSIKKKSSRIKERFSANLGFIDQTRDADFDREETRYRHLEKSVRIFVRDVQAYLEEVQTVVSTQDSLSADIEDYYAEKRDMPEVSRYQDSHGKIHMTFLPNFQREVDDLVTFPLNQLSQMFEGPNKVIQKRYDKLLDYDNMTRKSQNDKAFEKPKQVAKQNYEALNAQLLDELPRLVNLASQLFRDCVGSFVRAQREFTDQVLQEMYTVMDIQVLHDEGIIEQFNIKHTAIVDRLALLSFMPRAFSPRVADQKQDKKGKRMSLDHSMLKTSEAVPQIDSQRVFVTQQYSSSKLFRVIETHVAMDALDISVCEGDVVGVIMEKDPMGNRERWFVDNGGLKGFIPKKLLRQYETSPVRPQSGSNQLLQPVSTGRSSYSPQSPKSPGTQSTGSGSAMYPSVQEVDDEMDFALEEEMIPDFTDYGDAMNHGYEHEQPVSGSHGDDIQLYYAEFAFSSRNENEVSLFEHQVVTVISPHDQNGNTEWWYVEADGVYGYAPAAYLRRMDSHGDPT